MILYHGTSSSHLDRILKEGLRPRSVTGISNWGGKVESKTGFIYLTTAYPVYFALQAAMNEKAELAILEVDVPDNCLYPDEDFVAHCLKITEDKYKHMDLKDINPLVDMEKYRHQWITSLEFNGNVAVKRVEPNQIKRHVTIPLNKRNGGAILRLGGDSRPVPLNYKVCGQGYRAFMKRLFDEGFDALAETFEIGVGRMQEIMAELEKASRAGDSVKRAELGKRLVEEQLRQVMEVAVVANPVASNPRRKRGKK